MTNFTFPLTTSLNRIESENSNYRFLYRRSLQLLNKEYSKGDNIPFSEILGKIGFEQTLLCCRVEPKYLKLWREFGLWCAKRVEYLTEGLTSPPAMELLDVVERNINGDVTDEDLRVALFEFRVTSGTALPKSVQAIWAVKSAAGAYPLTAAGYASKAILLSVPDDEDEHLRTPKDWSDREAQVEAFLQLVTNGTLPPLTLHVVDNLPL